MRKEPTHKRLRVLFEPENADNIVEMGARLTSFATDILADTKLVARMMTSAELSEN